MQKLKRLLYWIFRTSLMLSLLKESPLCGKMKIETYYGNVLERLRNDGQVRKWGGRVWSFVCLIGQVHVFVVLC